MAGWLYLVSFLIAPAVVAYACIRYARRIPGSASVSLAVAAVSVLIVRLASQSFSLIVVPRLSSGGSLRTIGVVNVTLTVVSTVCAVWFAVSLLIVLRGQTR